MTAVPYEQRIAKKVKAISLTDPTDIIEYNSVSAAAKALEGQVPQRNVRALLTRTIAKNEVLLDRRWTVNDDISEGSVAGYINGSANVLPGALPVTSVTNDKNGNDTGSLRAEEIALKRHQIMLKQKQMELLIRYIDMIKDKNDPCILMLIKQYLS